MIIRDAEIKDAAHLDALLTRLIRDEAQYDSNLNKTCTVSDNYASRIGLEGHKLLLVETEGDIVGYLYGFIFDVPGMTKKPIAILDALFVDENHRGKGYATSLFAEFQKFVRENGACRIELKVLSKNAEALRLYEKLTFTETKKYMSMELSEE